MRIWSDVLRLFTRRPLLGPVENGPHPITGHEAEADDEQVSEWAEQDLIWEEEDRIEEMIEHRVHLLCDPHLTTFAKKYHQLAYTDDYGNRCFDKFINELGYFVDRNVMPDEIVASWKFNGNQFETRRERLLRMVDTYILGHKWDVLQAYQHAEYHAEMTGMEFEALVAAEFEGLGASVDRTPVSGDQGADLLVKKDGKIIAVQCKRSKSSVGNKAVQEASAGRGYYGATEAWVVSDAPFTTSAKQLAGRLDVSLLHFREIGKKLG